MEMITVGIADGRVATNDQVLISYALGSCVGVCLYDAKLKIAGMAHIILPHKGSVVNQENSYKFADEGIAELIREMKKHGANPGRMTAKIAGGAKMFASVGSEWEIGHRNVEAVKEALKSERIEIAAEDTGRDYGRTILFFAEDGRLEVRTVRKQVLVI